MLILTVRVCAFAPTSGVLAQLVERLNGIEEVRGSNPLGSIFAGFVRERVTVRGLSIGAAVKPLSGMKIRHSSFSL